eukprot:XP_005628700.1 proline-rich protein 2-like isoform X1 [Canis lupus familiaris]
MGASGDPGGRPPRSPPPPAGAGQVRPHPGRPRRMLRALRPGCAPGDPGCFLPGRVRTRDPAGGPRTPRASQSRGPRPARMTSGSFQCPLLMKLEILPPDKGEASTITKCRAKKSESTMENQ